MQPTIEWTNIFQNRGFEQIVIQDVSCKDFGKIFKQKRRFDKSDLVNIIDAAVWPLGGETLAFQQTKAC